MNHATRSGRTTSAAGPLHRWRAYRARRRADLDWARALAAASSPAHRAELLVLRGSQPRSGR